MYAVIFAKAEAEGFEPSDRFPSQQLSRLLHSTALPRLLVALPYTKGTFFAYCPLGLYTVCVFIFLFFYEQR